MALDKSARDALLKALPAARLFFDFDELPDYTKDATEISYLPDALFFGESEDEILAAVRICRQFGLPIILRGAGTGYSGGALTISGGLLLSIEKMDRIQIIADEKVAVVGPGAITGDIMKAAEKIGLFYPPDPASFEESTIGGNVAENAGGLRCKKYGVTKDYVVAVRGIFADGETATFDHSAPFGLLDVIIGSEGTLFIITEITLRLIDLPAPGKTIQATFANAVDAASVVAEVTGSGIVPCALEFMDRDAIECSNQFDPVHRIDAGAAMLLFETDGAKADTEAAAINDVCKKHNPGLLRTADDPDKRDLLWKTRRNLSNAVKSSAKSKTSEDVCVPPSRLPELVAFVGQLSEECSLRVNCYGHAGDGNLHVNFLGMTGSDSELHETDEGISRLFDKTLELDGTLSGEHGIGITKKHFLPREFDTSTLDFMARLKKAFDPDGFLNPGKIFV